MNSDTKALSKCLEKAIDIKRRLNEARFHMKDRTNPHPLDETLKKILRRASRKTANLIASLEDELESLVKL